MIAKNQPLVIEADIKTHTIRIRRCSTSWAKSPAPTRRMKWSCSAHISTLGTPPPARPTTAWARAHAGGYADPQGQRREDAADCAHRPLDWRRAGNHRLAQYVAAHFASRKPIPGAAADNSGGGRGGPGGGRFGGPRGPLELKPEHAKFDVYLNLDNGSGALRGVYLQGNAAVGPIFKEWMEPFRSLGMTTLTIRNTRGTDHESFDAVGLPAFQFIQDEIEYETVAHHTNMDTYRAPAAERLREDGDDRRRLRLPGGQPRRASAAQAPAECGASRCRTRRKLKNAPFQPRGHGHEICTSIGAVFQHFRQR